MRIELNSIKFHLIYIVPKQYNSLKELYGAQGLNPLKANKMATGARTNRKKP